LILKPTTNKGHPLSGGFALCGHFAHKGERDFSDANVPTFWCKNLRIFLNYSMSARTKLQEG